MRSLGDCLRSARVQCPQVKNFPHTPEVSCRTIWATSSTSKSYLVSAVFEGLFPRQADRMSDGFHTRFDGSPLFCRGRSSSSLSGRDPFERQRRPQQLHQLRWSPVGSAIILQSQVRSQHHGQVGVRLCWPGGTTGFVQVCDTVVNRSLKNRIEELADQYIDKNEKEWVEGKYSVGQRRVLLTKWVGQAWEDMHAEDSDMIRLAFKQVGLGLPVDGSQDHEIKIKDFPEVQVGNWKDWQPIRGEGDKLESNLTPEEVEKLASEIIVDDDDDVLDMDGTIIVDVE